MALRGAVLSSLGARGQELLVPHRRDVVNGGPHVVNDTTLTSRQEDELFRYYDLV